MLTDQEMGQVMGALKNGQKVINVLATEGRILEATGVASVVMALQYLAKKLAPDRPVDDTDKDDTEAT